VFVAFALLPHPSLHSAPQEEQACAKVRYRNQGLHPVSERLFDWRKGHESCGGRGGRGNKRREVKEKNILLTRPPAGREKRQGKFKLFQESKRKKFHPRGIEPNAIYIRKISKELNISLPVTHGG
jgi:hypothetical protein